MPHPSHIRVDSLGDSSSVHAQAPVGGYYLDGANLSRSPTDAAEDTDSLYQSGSLFARLIAGEESEQGEAPPRYDVCVAGASLAFGLAASTAGTTASVFPAPPR